MDDHCLVLLVVGARQTASWASVSVWRLTRRASGAKLDSPNCPKHLVRACPVDCGLPGLFFVPADYTKKEGRNAAGGGLRRGWPSCPCPSDSNLLPISQIGRRACAGTAISYSRFASASIICSANLVRWSVRRAHRPPTSAAGAGVPAGVGSLALPGCVRCCTVGRLVSGRSLRGQAAGHSRAMIVRATRCRHCRFSV